MNMIDIMHVERRIKAFFHPFGVIGVCLLLIGMCIILYCFNPFSFSGEVKLAITTGVSASALVTLFAEMIHNNRKNLVRVFALEDYFSAVFDYSFLRESQIKCYSDDEDKIWADALEEASKDYDTKGVKQAYLKYLVYKFKSIIKICETCMAHVDLLTYSESSVVKDIRWYVDNIERILKEGLRADEFNHDSCIRCIEDLHDLFDEFDSESSEQDGYKRLKQVFEKFEAENLSDLCSKITSFETVRAVREAINQAFEGYDFSEEESEEKQKGLGIDLLEYDTSDSGEYVNPAIQSFKHDREIEAQFQRNENYAHEYLVDFLQHPACISENNRSLIALYLVKIHEAMMKLEKLVVREPFCGEMIEFAKSRSGRKPVKGLLRIDAERDNEGD